MRSPGSVPDSGSDGDSATATEFVLVELFEFPNVGDITFGGALTSTLSPRTSPATDDGFARRTFSCANRYWPGGAYTFRSWSSTMSTRPENSSDMSRSSCSVGDDVDEAHE